MKMKIIKTLSSIAILTVVSSNSFAAGTEADSSINNRATINYNVGGTPQTSINSSPTGNSSPSNCKDAMPAAGVAPATGSGVCATTFKVDKKIDLLVTGGASEVEVVPGELGATGTGGTAADTIITYTLKNEGNSTESFTLTPSDALALTTGDEFNTSNCRVQSITGGAASPAPTTGITGTVSLPNEGVATITVECDIPPSSATVVNGAKSIVDLLAVVSATASTGTDTATGVEVVFADDKGTGTDTGGETGSPTVTGERNGKHSATNTYLIATAGISVMKVSSVVYDPFNGASDPKRIPGAIIKYDITVTNTGGTAATDLVITDVLDSNVLYRETTTTGVPANCTSSAGVTFTCSETPSGTMTSSAFTLPATTGTATMTFYVEIQ